MPQFFFRMRIRSDDVIRTVVNVTVMRKSASLPTSLHGRLSARAYPCVRFATRPLSLCERGRRATTRDRPYEVGSLPIFPSDISPAERGQPGRGFSAVRVI